MAEYELTLTEFLLARIKGDEKRARGNMGTVTVSGNVPFSGTPNCIGPTGHGCPERWSLPDKGTENWWKAPDVKAEIHAHEMTHATKGQLRALAECEAKRRIVALHDGPIHEHIAWVDPETQAQATRNGDLWCRTCGSVDDNPATWPCDTLRALAAVYASHADYRSEWAPAP